MHSRVSRHRWTALSVIWVSQTVSAFILFAIPPVAPFLQADLNLTRAQIGLFISAMYVGVAVLSIPSGNLTDMFGVRRMLLSGTVLMGLLIILASQVRGFMEIFVFLSLLGVAYSSIPPSTSKGVIEWFPVEERAMAMGVKQTGVTVGGLIAAVTLPLLAVAFDWRYSLMLAGAAAIIIGASVSPLYREFRENSKFKPSVDWRNLGEVFRYRNIVMISLVALVFGAVQLSFATYLVLYLKEVMGFGVVLAGLYLASANGAGTLARVVFGLISDRLFHGRRKIVLAISGCITTLMCSVLGLMPGGAYVWFVFMSVLILGFSAMGHNAVMITFVGESTCRELSGVAVGLLLTMISIGVIIGPPLFGYTVDLTETYSSAWLMLAFSMAAATALLTFFVKETKLIDSI